MSSENQSANEVAKQVTNQIHSNSKSAEEQTITKIVSQVKAPRRFNVFIDDEYAFSVHEDVLISCRIFKGMQMNRQKIEHILKQEEYKQMEQKGLRYLARLRTVQEVRQHLHEFPAEDVENILIRWQENGYLNDLDYAMRWISERLNKGKGKFLAAEELRKKGVATETIEQAVSTVADQAEYEACLAAATKKKKSYASLPDQKRLIKMARFLEGRGFPYDLIRQVIDEVLKDESELSGDGMC